MLEWGVTAMTERDRSDGDKDVDTDLDRTLTDALRPPAFDPQALDRVRAAVEHEWRVSAMAGRRARQARRRRWASLAAAVSVLAVTVTWFVRPAVDRVEFGSITRLGSGNVDVRFAVVRHRALHVGDVLRAGDTLTAHGPALLSLPGGGTLRIAADSVVDVTSANEIRLSLGMIYVDLPPAPAVSGPLRVSTRAGMIEHLGTEFEVLNNERDVRVRVREGRIRLRGISRDVVADAGTELLATPAGDVLQRPVATYGRDWLWIAAVAPDYEIEGQPLLNFLQWVSRELGRRLEFADPQTRQIAARTILHGNIRGREPLDALANVLSTTTLGYELRGDTIRVQSGP
jgi:ferric-dicitrate binding protein FerR (iron transport regulator)